METIPFIPDAFNGLFFFLFIHFSPSPSVPLSQSELPIDPRTPPQPGPIGFLRPFWQPLDAWALNTVANLKALLLKRPCLSCWKARSDEGGVGGRLMPEFSIYLN